MKNSGKGSDEGVLLKAFKYFDLSGTGKCTKRDFLNVVNKIGVFGASDKQLEELFEIYDLDGNGYLDYKEFSQILYGAKPKREKASAKDKSKKDIRTKYGDRPATEPAKPQSRFRSQLAQEARVRQDFLDNEIVQGILHKIRDKLAQRGVRGICSIGRNFR